MRTSTGRWRAFSRGVVRKPFGSAMSCLHDRLAYVATLTLGLDLGGQHALVVLGHPLCESLPREVPVGQQCVCHRRFGLLEVAFDDSTEEFPIGVVKRVEIDHLRVDPLR